MPRLIISAVLDFGVEKLNTETYNIDEIVELARLMVQHEFDDFDLEVSVRDYMFQDDI